MQTAVLKNHKESQSARCIMLPPHELKNIEFTKTLRGYSASEVDEHLRFVLDKYAELYRYNNELEKELKSQRSYFADLQANEEAIRRAMVNAQRSEHQIVKDAEERAETLLRAAKRNCDKMLSEFRQKIRIHRITLHRLRSAVAEFKENSLLHYNTHLEFLNKIAPDMGLDEELELSEEDYANELLEQMKLDITQNKKAEPKDIKGGGEIENLSIRVDNKSSRRKPNKKPLPIKKTMLEGREELDTVVMDKIESSRVAMFAADLDESSPTIEIDKQSLKTNS